MGVYSSVLAAEPAPTSEQPVSMQQYRTVVNVLRKTMERVDRLEKAKAGAGASTSGDGAVDLTALDSEPGKPPVATSQDRASMERGAIGSPRFKTYFDLNLLYRPGNSNPSDSGEFTFQNIHSYLFYEMMPDPGFQFAFDIRPDPKFYQMEFQTTQSLKLRAGKIWIPFDDTSPHNIFGGRVNVSTLSPNGKTFLPSVWAELGVGLNSTIADSSALKLVGDLYVVNGLGAGGTDPVTSTGEYPDFANASAVDQNRDKAVGGRLHALWGGTFGTGVSYYTGRWTAAARGSELPVSRRLRLLGIDSQLNLGATEFRVGLASMSVDLPTVDRLGNSKFGRGGNYVEMGHRFGENQSWKMLLRGGKIQLDDRAISQNDQAIVGATLLKRIKYVEVSLEHSRDIKKTPPRQEKSLTNLRLIVTL